LWLLKELGASSDLSGDRILGVKIMRSAAILSCSQDAEHKQAAFRVATQAYELFGDDEYPLSSILRVVLVRLGNLPSINTRDSIANALYRVPWMLAVEEIDTVEKQSIFIGDKQIKLTSFQHDLWSRLDRGQQISLSAPTSAGKSFVLQSYIRNIFSKCDSKNILYIVPTRALISQISQDLIDGFHELKIKPPQIINIPFEDDTLLPDSGIYVLTQERAQLILQSHKEFSPQIIITDEAQSISDGSRGILLQSVLDELVRRNRKSQFIFASPTIRNLDLFGSLLGLDNIIPLKSLEPTVAQNFLNVKIETAKKGIIRVDTLGDGTRAPTNIGIRMLNQTLASRKDKLVQIPLHIVRSGAIIIYANGAAEAEDVALQLADNLSNREITESRENLSKLASEVVHSKFILSDCVSKGVGFHYSNLPAILRIAIEKAFKEGHIDYLVSTSTLLQGVNLPAKHIFMCRPEKGRNNPLESTDFWNLSGRAGRLLKEFQGNIFLIDYDNWRKKPLGGPKDNLVIPSIRTTIINDSENFLRTIRDRDGNVREKNQQELDSSFLRVFTDFRSNRLTEMLFRLGISAEDNISVSLFEAINSIEREIGLPADILRKSANISPHRQQRLFSYLHGQLINSSRENALRLIPAHPRESDAYKSYERILEICNIILRVMEPSSKIHRFHALLCLRWMQGWPLPKIIQTQIERSPDRSSRKIIRDTLSVIESDVRFQSAQMFATYSNILRFCLDKMGFSDLSTSIPSISLYLEVGASDQTMISFMSLGLSRPVSSILNEEAPNKNFSPEEAKRWLSGRSVDSLGLSPLLASEIHGILRKS
jgi:hypothetical protein